MERQEVPREVPQDSATEAATAQGDAPDVPASSHSIVSPRLTADPRLRIWISRAAIAAALFAVFMLVLDWRYAVSVAVVFTAADIIYRSKTTSVIPASVRVTSAQRSTQRRLTMLQPAGYMSLHACRIPGTSSIIDHVVVGPPGVFTVDSERLDNRLTIRVIGGVIYHGAVSLKGRVDHADEEAQQAAALIGAELGEPVRVRAAMIIYGPDIPWKVMRFGSVDTLGGGRIGTYFRQQSKAAAGRQLSGDKIARIYAAAARALPPLDTR